MFSQWIKFYTQFLKRSHLFYLWFNVCKIFLTFLKRFLYFVFLWQQNEKNILQIYNCDIYKQITLNTYKILLRVSYMSNVMYILDSDTRPRIRCLFARLVKWLLRGRCTGSVYRVNWPLSAHARVHGICIQSAVGVQFTDCCTRR